MKLHFLGATETVTGSKYLVEAAGARILVDCGLFQGYKQLRLRNREPLPVEPASIDAVVLTHAHLDHSGYLPLLAREGFRGRVSCTAPTRDLCGILLPDSGKLLEEEAAYADRHGFSKHSPPLPLYTQQDAIRCLRLLDPVPFGRTFDLAPGLRATFHAAGHLPGAASVLLDDGSTRLLFSGDLGRSDDIMLKPPEAPPAADHVVVESTYGDRLHASADVMEQLADVINRTTARGGAVIIPAFAVGRAQALLHCVRVLKERRAIHQVPVFLNSPMAAEATKVYARQGDSLRVTRQDLGLLAGSAEIVESPDESRELNTRRGPMVIIAGSGMATGGRVVHHLKSFAPDHRNTILLVGFQAGGTRGASLEAGARTVRIHGEDVPVRAEVAKLDGFSSHADAAGVEAWLRAMPAPPAKVYITHGEPAAADALRQRIERSLHWRTAVPYYLEQVTLAPAKRP